MSHENPLTESGNYFSWKTFIKSFSYAALGILQFFKKEQNAKIHLVAAVVVSILSVWLRISTMELLVVIFSIALVWITEMINTALEQTMDMISPEWHPKVKMIKDLAAGAVLVAALAALLAGCLIFIPKLLHL